MVVVAKSRSSNPGVSHSRAFSADPSILLHRTQDPTKVLMGPVNNEIHCVKQWLKLSKESSCQFNLLYRHFGIPKC